MFSIPEIAGWWILPLGAEAFLLALEAVVTAAQGMKHGWFYAHKGDAHDDVPEWFLDRFELHYVDRRLMWVMYALLIAAGCDVVRVLLAQSVARPVFQGFINVGAGKSFISEEKSTYGEKVAGEWRRVAKSRWRGKWRVPKAALALLTLVLYAPLARLLLEALSLESVLAFLS